MPEILKLSSSNIKGWLERETSSIFVPVHTKAEKLQDEMREVIKNLTDASKMLLENSEKEIEKRNIKTYGRARALNKLARLFIDRLRQINVPEQVSYDALHEFAQDIHEAFIVTEIDIKNWFPRISPFFIFDRRKFLAVFENGKNSLKKLTNFLAKEYIKTKTLEETFQLIDGFQTLEKQLEGLKEQRIKVENEKTLVKAEITETQQKISDFKSKGDISQLDQLDMKIEALSSEVKQALRSLHKPFLKLQALSLHGGGSGLTPDELNKLNHYIENPFEAFTTDEADYLILRQLLQKLNRTISEGKISLKPDKKRKAEEIIDNIINKNSLSSLYQSCVSATLQREKLSQSTEVGETRRILSKLQEQLENLGRKMETVESEENLLNRAISETLEKIRTCKAAIEKNVFDFVGKEIRIDS
ncbi:MAG: hypothetical protein QXH37_09350 [Candidatus Bathyarchaeia archaeon]